MSNLIMKEQIDNCSMINDNSNSNNSSTNNSNNTSNINITTYNEVSKITFNIYNIPFNMYPEDNKPVGSVNISKIPSDKDLYNLLNSGEFIM